MAEYIERGFAVTNDFETVLYCLLVVCFAVLFYLAGRGNLFELAPKILLDRLEELSKKHGTWTEDTEIMKHHWCGDDVDMVYKCSVCEAITPFTTNYCHNCGAKMDGKERGK